VDAVMETASTSGKGKVLHARKNIRVSKRFKKFSWSQSVG
jgi:hypothetical protein